MKKKSLRRFFTALSVLLAAAVIYTVCNAAAIVKYADKDEAQKADVIIVLGAGTYGGEVSPVFRERINHAITLYNEGYAPKIIMTGGLGKGNAVSDAYAAKQYAISAGIPAEDILLEQRSSITQENLIFAREIMDKEKMKTAIIVSDPLHMKRAMLLARDAGVDGFSSPTPTTRYISLKSRMKFLSRELFYYIGYKVYRVFFGQCR